MYVCVHICILDTLKNTCMNLCMYVCMFVCICMYVCMYVCTSVCICMYVCMYVCMCAYVCMYERYRDGLRWFDAVNGIFFVAAIEVEGFVPVGQGKWQGYGARVRATSAQLVHHLQNTVGVVGMMMMYVCRVVS